MDHNQQIEALRMGAPERLGVERMRRVEFAAENAVKALDMVIADAERVVQQEYRRTQIEQSVRNSELNGAAAAVIAEAERTVSETDTQTTNPEDVPSMELNKEELTAKALAQASSAANNPLFGGMN